MLGRTHRVDNTYIRDMTEHRRQKDRYFARAPESPLPHEHGGSHRAFAGLIYYRLDPLFRVPAQVIPFAQPALVQLATSTGEIRAQVRYAELRFRIGGYDLRLAGFSDPHLHHTHTLFVPFRDATSGRETYGAGRYLEVEIVHHTDGTPTAMIDFNLAYSPYCAYSPHYSCPIPPVENTLPVAISAGERTYHEAR